MNRIKIVLIQNGVSAKSGKPYSHITIRGRKNDGSSVVNDFWLNESVAKKIVIEDIKEDDFVVLEMGLDENLRPTVTNICKEEEI